MSEKIYTIEEIKNKLNDIFVKKNYIDKVYLFGSYAKNTADSNSDIDLVVSLNAPVGMKLYSLYDEINEAFGKNADILTDKEIQEIMPKTFEKDKVLIYEQ